MIYTIGYYGMSSLEFTNVLKKFSSNILIDVRSTPYSKSSEKYCRDSLEVFMKEIGITYVWGGKSFGARYEDPLVYTNGYVDFDKVPFTEQFKNGIKRLNNYISRNANVCLMCSESNPIDCHRFSMIAKHLHNNGYYVQHIVNGSVYSHDKLEIQMANNFRTTIERSYRIVNERIGYRG